jgi:hypothetical protein
MTASNTNDLTVFITSRTSRCDECKEDLGRHAWITLQGEGRAVCLACADLDHLVFLPSGDTALTRRARKHSRLSAVVLKWSQARKRYERQGLLVEEDALTQAEGECAADAATREATRARAAERRAELDEEYVTRFAARVRELYPSTPKGRETRIAEHACRKYSGRVGRSAGAKALDEDAVRLAVAAHVRHTETPYDDLLAGGCDRGDARARVNDQVAAVIRTWKCSSRKTQKPANTEPQTRHC